MAEQRKIALVGGLATMPSREHTPGAALKSVLPQPTRLYIYLDKYERVPERAGQPTGHVPFDDWPHIDLNDLLLAIEVMRQKIPLVALAREAGHLHTLETFQDDSIARRAREDDSCQSRIMQEAIQHYREQAVILVG